MKLFQFLSNRRSVLKWLASLSLVAAAKSKFLAAADVRPRDASQADLRAPILAEVIYLIANDPDTKTAARAAMEVSLSGLPSNQRELILRRNRILAVMTTLELSRSGLSFGDGETVRLRELATMSDPPPDPALASRVARVMEEGGVDTHQALDGLSDLYTVIGIGVGVVAPIPGAAIAITAIVVKNMETVVKFLDPLVYRVDEDLTKRSTLLDPSVPREQALRELLGISTPKASDWPYSSHRYVRKAKEAIDAASQGSTAEEFYGQCVTDLDQRMKDLRTNILADIRSDANARENTAAESRRLYGESQGAVALGGVLIDNVFGNKALAQSFLTVGNESIRVWQLLNGFNAVPQTVGPMALTGGYVTAALAIGTALSGAPSAEQQTQKALAAILSAIQTLREEMHERFDRIERTQKNILETLDVVLRRLVLGEREQLARLTELRTSINGLRGYVETQARREKIDDLMLYRDNLKVLIDTNRSITSALETEPGRQLLNYFKAYSLRIARQPAFTHDELTHWNPSVFLDTLQAGGRPDLMVGSFNAICDLVQQPNSAPPPNPIEWARGVTTFLFEIANSDSELPNSAKLVLAEMYSAGKECESALSRWVEPEFRKRLRSKYEASKSIVLDLFRAQYAELLQDTHARYVLLGDLPRIPIGPYIDGGTPVATHHDEPRGFSWSEDVVHCLPSASVLLRGTRNPIEVAEELGMLEVEIVTRGDSAGPRPGQDGHLAHTYEMVKLRFRSGRWAGSVTNFSRDGNTGIERFKYRNRDMPSWHIFPATVISEGALKAPISIGGAAAVRFIAELRDDLVSLHLKLQRDYISGIQSYLERAASRLEDARSVGAAVRLTSSIAEWGQGAGIAEAAAIINNEAITFDQPSEVEATLVSEAAAQGFSWALDIEASMHARHSEETRSISDWACDTFTNLVSESGAALLQIESDVSVPLVCSPKLLEATMLLIRGTAYHHRIDL